jgi:putative ATPase
MKHRGNAGHVFRRLAVSLFEQEDPQTSRGATQAPLAEKMRPLTLDEFAGQEHLIAPGKPLRIQIERDDAVSMIFWGPPGVGKTTLAKLIAHSTQASFLEYSAVMSGVKEIKQVMAEAEKAARFGSRTILFIDEIHRFNKSQQDAFLPFVERGAIRLIGATTENPSFEIVSALLSRCRVYTLHALSEEEIVTLLKRALADKKRGLGLRNLTAHDEALQLIAAYSSGDARAAYNALEVSAQLAGDGGELTVEMMREALQSRTLMYDKSGEEHYNLISALHKSIRNSDPDATLYWITRMLVAGEDPMYLARRMVRMASEDIGLAAPEALNLCLSAKDAYDLLGTPEGELALVQAAIYLALAPKSNAIYTAFGEVKSLVENTRQEPVPLHLRNAPTKLMKELDYGKGYQYAHNEEGKVADMDCLPDALVGQSFYHPTEEGREKLLGQRLAEIKRIRAAKHSKIKT